MSKLINTELAAIENQEMTDVSEVAGPSPTAPRPRLCCLYRRSDYDGYGFNLYKLRQVGTLHTQLDIYSREDCVKYIDTL